jgi:response regulator RpfG family c-di-GMP phosphodiesterase
MLGNLVTILYPEGGRNQQAVEDIRARVAESTGTVHAKLDHVAKDGRLRTISMALSPMYDPSGQFGGVLSLGQDVTEETRLYQQLEDSYERIRRLQGSSIFALAKLAESRDGETGFHLRRIQDYCRVLCENLRNQPKYQAAMTQEFVDDLVQSSVLHDIGKVAIPDSVLFNPRKFAVGEYEIMKQHAVHGGRALEEAAEETGEKTYLSMGRDIAYYHHEHWDGNGYPYGLQGEEIPLAARIVAIADVYDALTTERRYKRAFSHEEAVSVILDSSGKQFDPALVDVFIAIEGRFRDIRRRYSAKRAQAL